jgi:hypothetical protein
MKMQQGDQKNGKQIRQNFGKSCPKSCQAKNAKNYIKAQFESPKQLY